MFRGTRRGVSFEIFGQSDGLSILYRVVRVDESLGYFFLIMSGRGMLTTPNVFREACVLNKEATSM